MATSKATPRYTKSNLWQLFVAVAFPIHVWAIVMILMDFGWIGERTNYWDAIGVGAYGLMFALIESLLVFGVVLLVGLVLPRRWPDYQRISLLGILTLMLTFWAMLGQLFFLWEVSMPSFVMRFLAGDAHPLRWLYVIFFVLVSITIAPPVLLLFRSEKIQKGFLSVVERVSTLMGLYLFLDVAGIVIVIIRNL